MDADMARYILQDQVNHLDLQVDFWKERCDLLEQDNDHLRQEVEELRNTSSEDN